MKTTQCSGQCMGTTPLSEHWAWRGRIIVMAASGQRVIRPWSDIRLDSYEHVATGPVCMICHTQFITESAGGTLHVFDTIGGRDCNLTKITLQFYALFKPRKKNTLKCQKDWKDALSFSCMLKIKMSYQILILFMITVTVAATPRLNDCMTSHVIDNIRWMSQMAVQAVYQISSRS